jgi:hypothetical protein
MTDETTIAPTPPSSRVGSGAASPALWLYLGIALDVLGFALIAVAWATVAGKDAAVDQVPALVAGGIGGLALVVVGMVVIDVQVARRDRLERDHQLRMLAALLDRVATAEDPAA